MVSGIGAAFDLQPKEAVDFFRQKGFQFAFDWTDMLKEEHDANFTVAKITDLDMLSEIRDAVDQAIAEGTTFETFKERLIPTLQEAGWWGGKMVLDADTGEEREVQLGSPRRLRTIFETNLKTAYAAGRYQQIQDTKDDFPYLMYDAVKDDRTRDEHLAWDGLVLPVDDPWWKTHYPPNGWNCRCSVIQVDDRTLGQLGKSGPDKAPPIETRPWLNPSTGEEEDVPTGIDPGWDYAPGMSTVEKAGEILEAKIVNSEPDLAAAITDDIPDSVTQAIDEEFSKWVENVLRNQANNNEVQNVGVMDQEILSSLDELGRKPSSGAILVRDREILHMVRPAKADKGKSLSKEDLKNLRQHLRNPKAVLFDEQDPALIYVLDLPDTDAEGRRGKVVIRTDFIDWVRDDSGKTKRKGNFVRTSGVVTEQYLTKDARYRVLKGKV